MGFKFASFGAATVPLSKVIVDSTLNMGDYALLGKKIMAPYRPYTWETEPFPYNDRTPRNVVEGITTTVYTDERLVASWTCDTPIPCFVRAIIPIWSGLYAANNVRFDINGVTVYTTGRVNEGTTITFDAVVYLGDVFEVYASSIDGLGGTRITNASIVDTGVEPPVNLDLKGRFLALEQDFGDLTVTLTFGDEENVPFTEYPNRFPCAPDKITIDMQKVEDRPVIKVYKGV